MKTFNSDLMFVKSTRKTTLETDYHIGECIESADKMHYFIFLGIIVKKDIFAIDLQLL